MAVHIWECTDADKMHNESFFLRHAIKNKQKCQKRLMAVHTISARKQSIWVIRG